MIRYRVKRSVRRIHSGISKMIQNASSKEEQSTTDQDVRGSMIRSTFKSDGLIHPTKRYSSAGIYQYLTDRSVLGSRNFSSRIMCQHLNCAKSIQLRAYCTASNSTPLPLLTDLEVKETPIVFSDLSHLIMTFFAIKPQLDRDFGMRKFIQTSKQVIPIVAAKLRTKDIDTLQCMVTPDVLEQIKKNLPKFTESQLDDLTVNPDDILFSFIYNMSISEDPDKGLKRLQVFTVHHVCNKLQEVKKSIGSLEPNFLTPPELIDPKKLPKLYVLNYRFSRTFNLQSGVAEDWVINGLNHQRKIPKHLF